MDGDDTTVGVLNHVANTTAVFFITASARARVTTSASKTFQAVEDKRRSQWRPAGWFRLVLLGFLRGRYVR